MTLTIRHQLGFVLKHHEWECSNILQIWNKNISLKNQCSSWLILLADLCCLTLCYCILKIALLWFFSIWDSQSKPNIIIPIFHIFHIFSFNKNTEHSGLLYFCVLNITSSFVFFFLPRTEAYKPIISSFKQKRRPFILDVA